MRCSPRATRSNCCSTRRAGRCRWFVRAGSWYLVLAWEALAAVVFCLVACWRWRRGRFWAAALTLPGIATCVGVELATQQLSIDPLFVHAAHLATPLFFV